MSSSSLRAHWRTPTVVLVCGGIVLTLSMGLRHGFGLFLQPMSADLHWGRETFALAMAVQNLVWGMMQPVSGMLADRYGTAKVVVAGALLYVLGLVTMAHADVAADAGADLRRADRHRACPVSRSASFPACSVAPIRPKSAAWRSASRRRRDRSDSSRCCR